MVCCMGGKPQTSFFIIDCSPGLVYGQYTEIYIRVHAFLGRDRTNLAARLFSAGYTVYLNSLV